MDKRCQASVKEINNYSDLMNFLAVNDLKEKKILVHACCAPCSSEVLNLLVLKLNVTIYYFNPNIYPLTEYTKRREEFNKLPFKQQIIDGEYEPSCFNEAIKGYEDLPEKSYRCYKCFELRLEATARKAQELNYDYFTTTLSISPHKNSLWINEIGKRLAEKYKISFLYSDFKKNEGYKKSLLLAKQYDLYRQEYCGCQYSLKNKNKNE